jgi:AraC-like DNA-binding protein
MPTLSEILRTKLIPWSQQDASQRFIIARTKMQRGDLPAGVQLNRHNIRGKRVVVKNRRNYSNVRNFVAEWPEDGLHELSKYALVCVLDGNINYPLGNYKIKCGAGHFIFISPGVPYPNGTQSYVDTEKSSACDMLTFLLHPNAVECWVSRGHAEGREQSNYCVVLHERAITLLQALMQEVVEEAAEDKQQAFEIGEVLLQAFLKILQREAKAERLQSLRIGKLNLQSDELRAGSHQADFATRLEYYVRANLRKPLTLERVARDMYLSRAQFVRNVRRETGETFNQLLARHRLEEAKVLLRDSEWTISTVAGLVGFNSTSYFGAFFKAQTGETPSDFRARSSSQTSIRKK